VRAAPILAMVSKGPWPGLLFVSLLGWVALFGSEHWLTVPGYCSLALGYWGALDGHEMAMTLLLNPRASLLLPWFLMLLAMMPPLLTEPMGHLWTRSLRRRRLRAVILFGMGYAAVWMLAGIVLVAAAIVLKTLASVAGASALALAILMAVLWQISPGKQTCLNQCHRLPRLSAFGIAADRDCLLYGVSDGLWCVGVCWAVMLVPLAASAAHVAWMAAGSILLLVERQAAGRPARWHLPPQLTSALAGISTGFSSRL
jgi:predicted metal-binding membrane protein